MRIQLESSGFSPGEMLTVSHYRIPLLKKIIPTGMLVRLDQLVQPTGKWLQVTPSVFVGNKNPSFGKPAQPGDFFICPECQSALDTESRNHLTCLNTDCKLQWSVKDGLYDFKEPI